MQTPACTTIGKRDDELAARRTKIAPVQRMIGDCVSRSVRDTTVFHVAQQIFELVNIDIEDVLRTNNVRGARLPIIILTLKVLRPIDRIRTGVQKILRTFEFRENLHEGGKKKNPESKHKRLKRLSYSTKSRVSKILVQSGAGEMRGIARLISETPSVTYCTVLRCTEKRRWYRFTAYVHAVYN